MAAGKCGVLVVFLAYIFINSFLENGPKIGFEGHVHSYYAHSNKLVLKKQLGYGKKILMDTFLCPCWYPTKRNEKGGVKRQVNGDKLIICICLLLSGDIHQCPGPMQEFGPRNKMASRPSACAMVCGGDKLLSMSAAEGSGIVRGGAGRSGGAGIRDSDPGAWCGAGQGIGSTGPRGAGTPGRTERCLQRYTECGFFHVCERITPASSQRQKPHRDPTPQQKQKGGNILFHRDMVG